jgi:23S rRNA pseudouridine1911/1915/1917 synthase
MSAPDIHVLFEDNHLLVVNKPAGLPTMGVESGRASLLEMARRYIKHKYEKPGNVYLGIVSRLDARVSGAIVLARTSKAAARLTKQFQTGAIHKVYWAVVQRSPSPATGQCTDWLRKDEPNQRMTVVAPNSPHSQEARLRYRTLQTVAGGVLVEIELLTGRKHQIRLQLGSRGWPVVGDHKYGGTRNFGEGIALHSRLLELRHPVQKTPLTFIAPLPATWHRFGTINGR